MKVVNENELMNHMESQHAANVDAKSSNEDEKDDDTVEIVDTEMSDTERSEEGGRVN